MLCIHSPGHATSGFFDLFNMKFQLWHVLFIVFGLFLVSTSSQTTDPTDPITESFTEYDVQVENEEANNTNSNAVKVHEFLDLTPNEKLMLEKFRTIVAPILTHDYMSSDAYLIRFLKQTHFNISASQDLMANMMNWRKKENIDNLLNEDFPQFESEYATFLEGCDLMNRPIISVPLGQWEIRDAVLAGQVPQLKRFMDKIFEDGTTFLRTVNDVGLQIYQATLILNLDGFDMKTHACSQCIELYLYFFQSLSQHYPGFVEKIYFVNTPQIATLIFDVYKDTFTPELRAMTTILRRDVDNIKKDLAHDIPLSSISKELGGEKEFPLDFSYIRMGQQLIASLHQVGAIKLTNNCSKDLAMYETLITQMSLVAEKKNQRKAKAEGRDYDPICDNEF